MADQNPQNPYASYGGAVAPVTPPSDPYASYGGTTVTPQAAPANPANEAQMFAATTGGQAGPAPVQTPMQTVPSPGNIGSRAWQAAKDEAGNIVQGVVAPVKAAIVPPQDASEHAIASIGGPAALVAYRTSRGLHDAANNLIQSKRENFQTAANDFANALNEFQNRNYRAAASDAASTVGGVLSLTGTNPEIEAGRVRDIAQGAKEGGDIISPLAKNVIDLGAVALAEKAPEIVRGAGKTVGRVSEAAGEAANKINTAELRPEMLTKRPEAPAPQHGAPAKVESPLDSATVGSKLGGKDLSAEALETLQQHVGDTIPKGGTAKGQLMKAVEPVQKTISDTASKMNQAAQDAHPFTTTVAQDSVFGEGPLTKDIGTLKEQLPPSVRTALSQDVDAVMQDADKALNSNDAAEVLEYRRKLGNQIDWDDISKNPTTTAEVQNVARAKVYRALGNKIHTEIPETVELDKTLQPNLELRSHMYKKLGERVVDDPHAATVEAQSELK